MGSRYDSVQAALQKSPRKWLITGVAGFIGSHLLERLLSLGQTVVGVDDFSTGNRANLESVQKKVGANWSRFNLLEGDIRDGELMKMALAGVNVVSHQAALASVPRSIKDPLATTSVNVDGFLQVALSARDAGIKRIVYASSSSVYGDSQELPKHEEKVGNCLSPYALSKWTDELYAGVFARCYGLEFVGLRYFNVFGPRQDPNGPYAAVLPRWMHALKSGEPCEVYGDGETSRDFCFVDNAVQANILSACAEDVRAVNQAYNVACGEQTSLNTLYHQLAQEFSRLLKKELPRKPIYKPFREGDVRHSLASIEKAQRLLGYKPTVMIAEGIRQTVAV